LPIIDDAEPWTLRSQQTRALATYVPVL